MKLLQVPFQQLVIEDADALRHVGLYHQLERILREDAVEFRLPVHGAPIPWGRALFLNLTFWNAASASDVLGDRHIPADVVAHVAWHHLARCALADGSPPCADALFLGEAIASAFDIYLVGRLLGHAPDAAFLESQVPRMAESAMDAGLSEPDFEALLETIAADPDRAFEDLRALLFDACTALVGAPSVDHAATMLAELDGRRFAPLIHHFELSNWILFARAHAPTELTPNPKIRAVDATLRAAPSAIAWLEANWVRPARAK